MLPSRWRCAWTSSTAPLYGPVLEDGRTQDKASFFQHEALPAGALRIADLGYFSLGVLQELGNQAAFFLSRLHTQTAVFNPEGKRLDLLRLLRSSDRLDIPVLIGRDHQLPVRLLAVRVPDDVAALRRMRLREEARKKCQPVSMKALELAPWTILVTNVPTGMLSLEEAMVLMRVRWQIELLFKLWKSRGKIDEWRSGKPWRILCEVYAKLTAMVIQHWLILTASWSYPDRSLVKAAQTIRSHALMLILAMACKIKLGTAIEEIAHCLASGCRMNRRKKAPNTYQLLLNLQEAA